MTTPLPVIKDLDIFSTASTSGPSARRPGHLASPDHRSINTSGCLCTKQDGWPDPAQAWAAQRPYTHTGSDGVSHSGAYRRTIRALRTIGLPGAKNFGVQFHPSSIERQHVFSRIRCPFAPPSLQGLHHYYGQFRPLPRHRYSSLWCLPFAFSVRIRGKVLTFRTKANQCIKREYPRKSGYLITVLFGGRRRIP